MAPAIPCAFATLLVFDHDPQVVTLIREILDRAGYRVFQARNESDVMRIVSQRREDIDLLVIDPTAPQTEQLLAGEPGLKILTLCSSAGGPSLPFLSKPFTPAQLLHAVRKLLSREDV